MLRKDLDELVFTGRSHMPEGLYGKMNVQQMADLFAFLGGREPPPRQFAGNQPQQIVRGPDTAFTMPASAAAIYGDGRPIRRPGRLCDCLDRSGSLRRLAAAQLRDAEPVRRVDRVRLRRTPPPATVSSCN